MEGVDKHALEQRLFLVGTFVLGNKSGCDCFFFKKKPLVFVRSLDYLLILSFRYQ